MVNVFEVDQSELVEAVASELKKNSHITPPKWAVFVKTGIHKERPPVRDDWWHVRAASVLKKIHVLGPIGVSKLRTKYGGKQRRGYAPPITAKGSGNIIRKILQQLEKAGMIKQVDKPKKGRITTNEGKSLLEKTATRVKKRSRTKSE